MYESFKYCFAYKTIRVQLYGSVQQTCKKISIHGTPPKLPALSLPATQRASQRGTVLNHVHHSVPICENKDLLVQFELLVGYVQGFNVQR